MIYPLLTAFSEREQCFYTYDYSEWLSRVRLEVTHADSPPIEIFRSHWFTEYRCSVDNDLQEQIELAVKWFKEGVVAGS